MICVSLEHALHARAFHGAGQDGIDANAEVAEFARQCFGETDQAHLVVA